jgi:hypothetical protein
MHWLYENINRFMVPMAILLCATSCSVSYFGVVRPRKQGRPPVAFPKWATITAIIVILVCTVLFGMALARIYA